MTKNNGDMVKFVKTRDYVMVNNNLGNGSFGKTVLLKDPFIDELLVAKKYAPDDEEIKERFYSNFLDEIKILYKLNHRNVVRIYHYYAYENISTGFILMEYVDGKNIKDFISELWDFLSPMSLFSLDDVFSQLIDGFEYIENCGILHRDIREGNIMVDRTGTAKIIDFGIGKIVNRDDTNSYSLGDDINRYTLPQEHSEGVYTSKTDMFYLGELLHRLIRTSEDFDDSSFSYSDILEKMMQTNPEDRFSSFADIREAINSYDFVNMDVSTSDKQIYQNFTNALSNALSAFIDEKKFNNDTKYFVSLLEKALRDNCFEDNVQNNSDIIRSVVVGGYKYNPNPSISCETVKAFLDWFKRANQQSQQLILNNIIAKVSLKRIDESEPELPF